MQKKATIELLNEINSTSNVEQYFHNNQNELINLPLSMYLEQLLCEKQLTKAAVIERSFLNKSYAYHLFLGDKKPSRDKVIALGFGFQLNADELNKLLRYSGNRELYPRDKRDAVILYAIKHKISVVDCDMLLSKCGLCLLI